MLSGKLMIKELKLHSHAGSQKRPRPLTHNFDICFNNYSREQENVVKTSPGGKQLLYIVNFFPTVNLRENKEIARNTHGCLKIVNSEGFRHSSLLNASTEADIRCCSCMKHSHSEVCTAVHNGKHV